MGSLLSSYLPDRHYPCVAVAPVVTPRGGNSGALSVISGSFYQISSVLFFIPTRTTPPCIGSHFGWIRSIRKSHHCGNEIHLDEIIPSVYAKIWIHSSCQSNRTDRRSVIMSTESHNEIKQDFRTTEIVIIKSR